MGSIFDCLSEFRFCFFRIFLPLSEPDVVELPARGFKCAVTWCILFFLRIALDCKEVMFRLFGF